MKISDSTLSTLKNFSAINQGIIIKPGNKLRTMSIMRNIFAANVVPDTFPIEFAVYDLPEFLSAMSLLDSPELDFQDKFVKLSNSSSTTIKYYYSSPALIVSPPDKEIKIQNSDVQFNLPKDILVKIQQASGVMKLKDLRITNSGLSVVNAAVSSGNQYDISADIQTNIPDLNIVVKIDLLKIIPEDYKVVITVGEMTVVNLKCASAGMEHLEYYIAVQS